MALNCDQLRKQDVDQMMRSLLYEFPVTDMEFYLPRWLDVLPKTHELKKSDYRDAERTYRKNTDDERFS